jgi:hypothetical protein
MNDLRVRQAVLSDLDDLAALFDPYRVFQGRPSDPDAARAFLRERFDHGELCPAVPELFVGGDAARVHPQ